MSEKSVVVRLLEMYVVKISVNWRYERRLKILVLSITSVWLEVVARPGGGTVPPNITGSPSVAGGFVDRLWSTNMIQKRY